VSAIAGAMQLASTDDARLRACVEAYTSVVWRVVRRNGVPESEAEDAVQRVFMILSRRLPTVDAGSELPFLVQTATHIASETRRTIRRRHEGTDAVPDSPTQSALPDDLFARREAVEQLDGLLDAMDQSLREVFVLYELEELTMAQIAQMLDLAPGTVASRLRRARARFEELCAALQKGLP
jgi:RNA polymerase sigma-70 factor, ECF subfamily